MKYSALKEIPVKKLNLDIGAKGVNLLEKICDIEEGELSEGKNVYIKNGRITTRPAIKTDIEKVLSTKFLDGSANVEYTLTDSVYYLDGEYSRIATAEIYYDNSNYFVKVFLIGVSGEITELGEFHFARSDNETYFIPQNMTFYVGKPQKSSGVFALVSLVNKVNFSEYEQRVYEFDFTDSSWKRTEDFYIPTILINGRGNAYEIAKDNGPVYTALPQELESPNLLSGKFYAYYTSDGHSSSFRLPFTQIADSDVVCLLNHSERLSTEWIVKAGETSSTLEFFGSTVTMNVDREIGIIYFTENGTAFQLPQMTDYAENNIKILAQKEIENGLINVTSCSTCTVIGDKTVFSGGKERGRFYYTSFENPLYFPRVFENVIGSPKTEVESTFALNDSVLAFKKDGVWEIDVKTAGTLNKTALVRDNSAFFKGTDSFTVKPVTTAFGCVNKNTIAQVGDSAVWLSSDNNIYKLSGGKVYNVSMKIKPFLETLSYEERANARASVMDGYYMLCFGNKAVIIETEKKETPTFLWEFDDNISVLGAFSFDSSPTLFCINPNDNTCFIANLGDGKDCYAIRNKSEAEIKTSDFESRVTTKSYFPFSLGKKAKLNEVCLQFEAYGDTDIKAISGNNVSDFRLYKADICACGGVIKLKPNLKCEEDTYLEFKSLSPFSLGRAELYFNKLN